MVFQQQVLYIYLRAINSIMDRSSDFADPVGPDMATASSFRSSMSSNWLDDDQDSVESSIDHGDKKPKLRASIHPSKNNLVQVIHREERELPGHK